MFSVWLLCSLREFLVFFPLVFVFFSWFFSFVVPFVYYVVSCFFLFPCCVFSFSETTVLPKQARRSHGICDLGTKRSIKAPKSKGRTLVIGKMHEK